MDLTLKAKVYTILGDFWNQVFLDTDFIDGQVVAISSLFDRLQTEARGLYDYTSRTKIPPVESRTFFVLSFREGDLDTQAYHYGDAGLTYGDGALYGTTLENLPRYKYPLPGGVAPKYLTTEVLSTSSVLTLGVDYTVADGFIVFHSDPLTLPGLQKRVYANDADGSPLFAFILWGFQTTIDYSAIGNFFGYFAGIAGDSSQSLKDAVNLAWDLRVSGASVRNVRRLLSIITRVDYRDVAAEGEPVIDVYVEGDRQCVLTGAQLYTAPATATVLVKVGDIVYPDTDMFDMFTVRQGLDPIDFADFEGLVLDRGHVPALNHGGGLLFVNDLVSVTREHAPGWVRVQYVSPGYNVLDDQGRICFYVATEAEAEHILETVPTDLFAFYTGGFAPDVLNLMLTLNSRAFGQSFFDLLTDKYGKVPALINPFQEINEIYLGANSFYIKIRYSDLDGALAGQLFDVLRVVLPAGAGFFVLFESRQFDERCGGDIVGEGLDIWYDLEYAESVADTAKETVAVGSIS